LDYEIIRFDNTRMYKKYQMLSFVVKLQRMMKKVLKIKITESSVKFLTSYLNYCNLILLISNQMKGLIASIEISAIYYSRIRLK